MRKKADLTPYAIMSLVMGAALLVMFYRLGVMYGDSSNRIDDYMVKDSALFLTALHALPGNMVVNFYYPVHEKIIDVNASRVAILRQDDEVFREHFTYRTIGTDSTKSQRLENNQYFEISKSSNAVGVNVPNNLDLFSCPSNPNEKIEFAQIFFSSYSGNNEIMSLFARNTRDSLRNRLGIRFVEDINNIKSPSTRETDISIIFSDSKIGKNEFIAYIHYNNLLSREIACRIINEFILDDNIEGSRFLLYSIDPDFYEINGVKLEENMIFLEMGIAGGVSRNSVRLQNKIYNVLREYT